MAHILIISQVFYPDMSAVSQVLTDLAEDLSVRGHAVDVYSSRDAYENPTYQLSRLMKSTAESGSSGSGRQAIPSTAGLAGF